jgi:hypothetical protein
VKETFRWVLLGTSIIFVVSTILAETGPVVGLGQDEDMLFLVRIISLIAAVASAIGAMVT